MELKITIGYRQITELVRQFPAHQIAMLAEEIRTMLISAPHEPSLPSFSQLLLAAPTMSDEQYEQFLENRKQFNQWRSL